MLNVAAVGALRSLLTLHDLPVAVRTQHPGFAQTCDRNVSRRFHGKRASETDGKTGGVKNGVGDKQ